MIEGPFVTDPTRRHLSVSPADSYFAAQLPTTVAIMVINSVRIQEIAHQPSLIESIATSLGTHGGSAYHRVFPRRTLISSRIDAIECLE